jgi:hypothetical protein
MSIYIYTSRRYHENKSVTVGSMQASYRHTRALQYITYISTSVLRRGDVQTNVQFLGRRLYIYLLVGVVMHILFGRGRKVWAGVIDTRNIWIRTMARTKAWSSSRPAARPIDRGICTRICTCTGGSSPSCTRRSTMGHSLQGNPASVL